ncbi:MAG: hypothetical protein NVS2B17_12530 [Candidatus Velthaea sp.]
MSEGPYDVAIVGGGHNGLVAAAYCARAGLRTILLERRPVIGGATLSEEVWPGYTVSVASYVCSLFDPRIIAELDLRAHGYDAYRKDPASFTPLADGRSLLLGSDDAENARELRAFDERDVAGIAAFEREATRLGSLLFESFDDAEPSFERFDDATQATLRGSAAELVERYVRTPVLQATLATDGLIGTGAGPRDPGTAYVLAHHYAGRALGTQGAWGFVRGGMGALAQAVASAARALGATLRTDAPVERIVVRDGRARGLELRDGTRIEAAAILINAAPQIAFLQLLERADVPPAIYDKAATWQSNGMACKLNLALGELPDFRRVPARTCKPTIARRFTSRRRSTISRRHSRMHARAACRANRCSSVSCRRRPTRRSHRPASTSSRYSRSTSRTSGRTGAGRRPIARRSPI